MGSLRKAGRHTSGLEGLNAHPIGAWSAVVGLGQSRGFVPRVPLADLHKQAPEPPGLFRLRLGLSPLSQVWQTDGRLGPLAPASRVARRVTSRRVPLLHGRSPASPLLRTLPPPARLRPTSQWLPVLRPPVLHRVRHGTRRASPVASRVLVTVPSLSPRRSASPPQPDGVAACGLRPPDRGLGLRASPLSGPPLRALS